MVTPLESAFRMTSDHEIVSDPGNGRVFESAADNDKIALRRDKPHFGHTVYQFIIRLRETSDTGTRTTFML
jgi:hypothetical protein